MTEVDISRLTLTLSAKNDGEAHVLCFL